MRKKCPHWEKWEGTHFLVFAKTVTGKIIAVHTFLLLPTTLSGHQCPALFLKLPLATTGHEVNPMPNEVFLNPKFPSCRWWDNRGL